MESELRFNITIFAPHGLDGVEPHMHMCKLPIQSRKSSFREIVILELSNSSDEGFEFQMAHPTQSEMFGSGFLTSSIEKAFEQLLSLSQTLSTANFPHVIGLDFEQQTITISYHYDAFGGRWLDSNGNPIIPTESQASSSQKSTALKTKKWRLWP